MQNLARTLTLPFIHTNRAVTIAISHYGVTRIEDEFTGIALRGIERLAFSTSSCFVLRANFAQNANRFRLID